MYRFEGRARMATLGLYPKMSVATAHAAAGALMEALESGRDPARERIEALRELQQEPNVEKLCNDYLVKYAKKRKYSCKEYLIKSIQQDLQYKNILNGDS